MRNLQNVHILLEQKPRRVKITETWLHPLILDIEIVRSSYIVLRKERTARGGGVAILLRNGITYIHMPDIKDVEPLWCKVTIQNYTIDVGLVYHPQNSDLQYLQNLYDYMQANNKGERIIMAGDINVPEIDWESLHPEWLLLMLS